MNDNVEIIRSNKGGMKIIHRGYMYTVHKKRQGGGIRWRCTQRSLHCKGSISTGNGPPSVNMPHNHIPDPHSVALARCRQLEEFPDINSLLETEYEEIKDSMPLQQRIQLSAPPQVQIPSTSDSVLQSQPLSPTKLKVTRQVSKQQATPPPKPESESPAEEVCLRWNSHHSNMQSAFPQLLEKEQYVDATIIAEDKTLKCHRMILSSCSTYFEEIFNGITPLQHPVIILKGTPFWILKALIDFMYVGEINIDQNNLSELLDVAELLKVKGLAGKTNNSSDQNKKEPETPSKPENPTNQSPKKPTPKENGKPQPAKNPPQLTKNPPQPAKNPQPPKNPPQLSPIPKVEEMPINDPLDLLEPKFHEEMEGSSTKSKDIKLTPVKKILTKKFRKRKSTEEEAVRYTPPMFPMRRGTRSRPNVKIPRYYDYEDIVKPTASDVQQPFSPVAIKSEPVETEESDFYNESSSVGIDTENSSMEITCINPKSLEKNPINKDSPICIKNKSPNSEEKSKPTYRIKIKSFSSLSEQTSNKPANDEEEIDFQKTAATISLVVKPNSDKENKELEKISIKHSTDKNTAEERDPLESVDTDERDPLETTTTDPETDPLENVNDSEERDPLETSTIDSERDPLENVEEAHFDSQE